MLWHKIKNYGIKQWFKLCTLLGTLNLFLWLAIRDGSLGEWMQMSQGIALAVVGFFLPASIAVFVSNLKPHTP